MSPKHYVGVICGSLWLISAAWLPGQVTTTTVRGTVTDRSGAVVRNAEVTVSNLDTGFSRLTQSNAEGQYLAEFLPVGTYEVTVSASRFKKFVQSGILLEVNRVARVDALLDVGAANETVEVKGDAPPVNTDNATIGRTVENAEITTLPI